jgi:hypothetical protein
MNHLEQQFAQAAARPQLFGDGVGGEVAQARVVENLYAVHAELDAPREPRLARALRRLGVPDLTIPLVTATPALRRSWFVAVAIAILFSLSVASGNTGGGVDRIAVFLTLAPLVPLLGVALAFGKGVDPTHDLVVAAPRDTFTVFLIRALTVLVASSLVLLVSSLLLPEGGAFRVAWLLPAVAISAITLATATRFDPRRAAAVVGSAWLMLVIIVAGVASSSAMFGPVTQLGSLVVGAAAGWYVVSGRERFDREEASA